MTTPFLKTLTRLGCLGLALGAWACSSDGATQTTPPAGKGGAGSAGSSGKAGSSGSSGASAGTGSGNAGESGAAGDSGLAPIAVPWLHTEGNMLLDANGNTVILRGVDMIDLPATQEWEGGINAMIDRLTDPDDAQGTSPGWATKILRMAITPEYKTDQGSPAKYAPGMNYYERFLRPAVDYAKTKGLYAIIDWHDIDDTSIHAEETAAFWRDIAPRFASDSNVLFELFNEPKDSGSWPTTKPNMQAWYDIVRAAAPDNLVLVGTPSWCQIVGNAAADPLVGTNIMYVAHMYPQHWAIPSLRDQITTAAQLAPVFVSEWGFQERPMDDLLNGTITSYGAPFKAFIEERRVSWTAWCASSSWGPPMFNRDQTLRVGEGEMGGFVKDWLYEDRDSDQPAL